MRLSPNGRGAILLVLVIGLFGLLTIGVAFRFGLTAQGLIALPTVVALALAGLADLRRKIIPDWVTLPALAWVLAASVYLGFSRAAEALLGALVCGGALLVLAVVSRGAIGGGDVKLTALVGAFLGWRWGFLALFFAHVAAALVALSLMIAGRKGRKDALPFGPFLSTFALFGVLAKPL
jgi:prepilin signal peptidase PulO-like enzyme (type II secretory pathway)